MTDGKEIQWGGGGKELQRRGGGLETSCVDPRVPCEWMGLVTPLCCSNIVGWEVTDKKLKRWRFYLQHIDCFWRRNGNIYIRTDNVQVNKSERVIFRKQNRFITKVQEGEKAAMCSSLELC